MNEVPFEIYVIPAGETKSGKKYDSFSVLETPVPVPLTLVAAELKCEVSAVRQKFTQYGCSYSVFSRTPVKKGTFTIGK
jgi:hypothetical protein